jgi:hypothetical protein
MSIGVLGVYSARRASLCILVAAEILFTFRRHSDVFSLHFGFELPNASTMRLHQDSNCVFATRLQVEFMRNSQWHKR